jgi:hypothetical protein
MLTRTKQKLFIPIRNGFPGACRKFKIALILQDLPTFDGRSGKYECGDSDNLEKPRPHTKPHHQVERRSWEWDEW